MAQARRDTAVSISAVQTSGAAKSTSKADSNGAGPSASSEGPKPPGFAGPQGGKHHRMPSIRKNLAAKLDGARVMASLVKVAVSGISLTRIFTFAIIGGCVILLMLMLNVDQMLKSFLLWLKNDVGPWGPVIMAVAYIPLNILALPGSILTVGGGYIFGLPVGFIADSLGSTAGATAAFLVGKTVGRQYVATKLKEFPQFQPIAKAISKSGFKIVLLLRLVPLLPFNVMNYVLSVTPVSLGSYIIASWLGMMPVTFVFVYLGTTIKDISEIGSPESTFGPTQWWLLAGGLFLTVLSTVLITRVAKDALQRAIDEEDVDCHESPPPPSHHQHPLPFTSAHREPAHTFDAGIAAAAAATAAMAAAAAAVSAALAAFTAAAAATGAAMFGSATSGPTTIRGPVDHADLMQLPCNSNLCVDHVPGVPSDEERSP